MNRQTGIERLRERDTPWDIVIIGGGATGVAVALDAATRGLDVVLLEQSDFGKGTSSRSTKLVHGGVRYLRQGNISLVRDALRERTLLRRNAPHLVHDMPFLIPCEGRWLRWYYGIGLKVYDLLATGKSFGRSRTVSTDEAHERVPTLKRGTFTGGVIYHDGQFDDARLLISMVRTAHDLGATLLNYTAVTGFTQNEQGRLTGVVAGDEETSETLNVSARCVVNATGPFGDALRKLDDVDSAEMLTASQGVHLVLPRKFFPGQTAMIVPKTSDGRVIFLIPWHDHVIVGTTDTPVTQVTLEPTAQEAEIEYLLETASRYLEEPPTRADVLSIFTGIRPLVKGDKSARTASLSRDHVIRVSPSGLITITGGKWTTVRLMAQDCVDRVLVEAKLRASPCGTHDLRLHGYCEEPSNSPRAFYGSDLKEIESLEAELPELGQPLHELLPIYGSDVIWAVRHEMARTIDDVLARRTRCLFLNAAATLAIAPKVAQLMASELHQDGAWCEEQLARFRSVADHFLVPRRAD